VACGVAGPSGILLPFTWPEDLTRVRPAMLERPLRKLEVSGEGRHVLAGRPVVLHRFDQDLAGPDDGATVEVDVVRHSRPALHHLSRAVGSEGVAQRLRAELHEDHGALHHLVDFLEALVPVRVLKAAFRSCECEHVRELLPIQQEVQVHASLISIVRKDAAGKGRLSEHSITVMQVRRALHGAFGKSRLSPHQRAELVITARGSEVNEIPRLNDERVDVLLNHAGSERTTRALNCHHSRGGFGERDLIAGLHKPTRDQLVSVGVS
jgi:hypothetical protein